jgi:integrase
MASITRRVWFGRGPTGRKIKKVAFGFSVMEGRERIRKYDAGWSREDAEKALAAYQLGIKPIAGFDGPSLRFGEAVLRYLDVKAKKHSLRDDRHRLERLKVAFGAATPLASITASRIAEYKVARLKATIQRDGEPCPIAPATLNRELAALRCLLRMACNEWEIIAKVPHIRLEREAQGRLRYLTNEEEVRLLAACEKSRNKDLFGVVTVALETGMRRGEILGLTWDRVDLSRGVLRLEITKSGRRREVPMRRAVYGVLAARPEPRVGRVWPDRQMRKAFETAAAVAQVDDFRFHDLRHTFASNFVMRGGSLQALKEILGHGSMAMTVRYAHLAPEHVRGEMERTATGAPMSQGLSGALGMRRILGVQVETQGSHHAA